MQRSHHSFFRTCTHFLSLLIKPAAWGSERWWCTWRSVALCPVCVAGFWIVPLWPLSTGSSQKVRLWFSAPVITIPTSGWTVSQTPQEYLTVNTTPPWWTCLVRKKSGLISWFHVNAGSLIASLSLCLVGSFPPCLQGPGCRLCDLWLLGGCSCPHWDEMYQNRRFWARQRQSYICSSVDIHGIW